VIRVIIAQGSHKKYKKVTISGMAALSMGIESFHGAWQMPFTQSNVPHTQMLSYKYE